MSQHHFETVHGTNRVDVVLGWDRPLHHFFLWVEHLRAPSTVAQAAAVVEAPDLCDAEDPSEDFMYHNLDDAASIGASLSYFRRKLAELDIAVPETMFIQVLRDKALNIGNRYVVYRPDGSFEG